MKKYKICVYAISKNEEKFVDRWMDSVSEADEVFVLDTGSTDETVEKLKKRGASVFNYYYTYFPNRWLSLFYFILFIYLFHFIFLSHPLTVSYHHLSLSFTLRLFSFSA